MERLYEEMLSYNLEPGEVSDKAVAAAVATTGNWERGLKLLEKRQDSAEVIGNVARACAEGHQWQKVLELLEEAKGARLRPNLQFYEAALQSCKEGRQWQKSLDLLKEAQGRGFRGEALSSGYQSAMAACAAEEKWGVVHGLFEEMQKEMTADVESYRLAMEASHGLKCPGNTIELLRSAEEHPA